MDASAIILGGSHHNTLGLIRSLGRAGVRVSLVLHDGKTDSYLLRSRYLAESAVVADVASVVPLLKGRKPEPVKPVVFCASDGAAREIDLHRNELADTYCLPGCGRQGEVARLMDKAVMARLAASCGLRVPASIEMETKAPQLEAVPYPCIVKPLLSTEGAKSDICVCENEAQLRAALLRCQSPRVQVQAFIDKAMEYQLIGVSTDQVRIPGRSRILSQPMVTNTGFLHYEHLDGTEPVAECERFLRECGFRGLFSMEFLRDREGRDWFMEINFRNDGNAIAVTEAGANMPLCWFRYGVGAPTQTEPFSIREIYVMPEFDEIQLWNGQRIGWRRMWREMKQADAFMEYDPEDPAPTRGKSAFWGRLLMTALFKRPYRILSGKNRKR